MKFKVGDRVRQRNYIGFDLYLGTVIDATENAWLVAWDDQSPPHWYREGELWDEHKRRMAD